MPTYPRHALALLALLAATPGLRAETPPSPTLPDEVGARFKLTDADHDGFVTPGEQLAYLLSQSASDRKLTPEQLAAVEQLVKSFIADSDINGDGRLTLAEMRAPGKDGLIRMFKAADTNGDGYATRAEMRVSVATARGETAGEDASTRDQAIDTKVNESLALFDFDGDGRISYLELKRFSDGEAAAAAAPTLTDEAVNRILDTKPGFADIDTDQNKTITAAELTAWMRVKLRAAGAAHEAAFKAKGAVLMGYDADGDGKLSPAEWDAGLNARKLETTAERVDRLIEVFAALSFADLDADKNGVISEGEVAAASDKLAAGAPEADRLMLRMVAGLNLTKRKGDDGKITHASWDAATARYEAERMKERIEERFKAMDTNGDGAVVAAELVAYMAAQQDEKPDAEKLKELAEGAAQYVGTTDLNADNRIDLAEYTEAVLESQHRAEREEHRAENEAKLAAILAAHPLSAEQTADLTAKFKAMDATDDGLITLAEMIVFVKTTATANNAGKALTPAQETHAEKQCATFMEKLDTDGDKAASLKEYLAFIATPDAE